LRLRPSEKAIDKAEIATEKRFESVNEFRAQLSDQTNTFLPREVYDTNHRQFSDRVAAIEVVIATTAGREKGIGLSASTLIAGPDCSCRCHYDGSGCSELHYEVGSGSHSNDSHSYDFSALGRKDDLQH